MNPASQPARLRWFGLPLLLVAGACQHGAYDPSAVKAPSFQLPLPPPKSLRPEFPRPHFRPIDPRQLDRADFIPPGAQRIGPRSERRLALAPENCTRFPSTALAPAPDASAVLFHDAAQRRGLIIHWLMLLRKTAATPDGIFTATTAFDASWSPDSRRFAVTNYSGDNSSEVFAEEVDELRQRPLGLRPLIEEFFPEHVFSAPMFVKAYRWTRDGLLVLRGIGRVPTEPYDEFGCEALVIFGPPGVEPRLEFLNGYVLPASAEP